MDGRIVLVVISAATPCRHGRLTPPPIDLLVEGLRHDINQQEESPVVPFFETEYPVGVQSPHFDNIRMVQRAQNMGLVGQLGGRKDAVFDTLYMGLAGVAASLDHQCRVRY